MEKEYAFRLWDKDEFLAELKKRNYTYDKKGTKCVCKMYRGNELPLGWIFDQPDGPSILLIRYLNGPERKATIRASSDLVKLDEEL
jgi:hypothetical protein